ncbi:MAG: OB-fold nucleic acid binding domain-containing protein, partial [Janthinobacterium lividum]
IHFDDNNNKSILYALGAIKNVTASFGELLLKERTKNGLFKDIVDLVERMPLKSINKRLLENLIKAGCFDELHANRNQLLHSTSKLLAYSVSYHNEKISDQISLIKVSSLAREILVDAEILKHQELAFNQFDVIGFFIGNHPLNEYNDLVSKLGIKKASSLWRELPNGSSQVRIAGVIQKKDARMSARGRFITLQLSDQNGIFDLTIFSEEILKNYAHLLNIKSLVVANCEAFKDEGGLRITAKSFSSFDELIKSSELSLKILSKNYSDLNKIMNLLDGKSSASNNIDITLFINIEDNFIAKINLDQSFSTENLDLTALKEFYNSEI